MRECGHEWKAKDPDNKHRKKLHICGRKDMDHTGEHPLPHRCKWCSATSMK